jgi:hypothetical protein
MFAFTAAEIHAIHPNQGHCLRSGFRTIYDIKKNISWIIYLFSLLMHTFLDIENTFFICGKTSLRLYSSYFCHAESAVFVHFISFAVCPAILAMNTV